MPIGPVVDVVTIVAFAALLIGAAIGDARHYLIPNRICIFIILLYPIHVLAVSLSPAGIGALNWIGGIALAFLVFVVGTGLFAVGVMGGGDVKLLAATTLWAGPEGSSLLLIITALTGAAIALGILLRVRKSKNSKSVEEPHEPSESVIKQQIPYGIAIAFGGIMIAGQLFGAVVAGWST